MHCQAVCILLAWVSCVVSSIHNAPLPDCCAVMMSHLRQQTVMLTTTKPSHSSSSCSSNTGNSSSTANTAAASSTGKLQKRREAKLNPAKSTMAAKAANSNAGYGIRSLICRLRSSWIVCILVYGLLMYFYAFCVCTELWFSAERLASAATVIPAAAVALTGSPWPSVQTCIRHLLRSVVVCLHL